MKLVKAINSGKVRVLDYTIGLGAVGYGVYSAEWWAVGLGVMGLGMTFFNVAQKASDKLVQTFAPKTKVDHSSEVIAAQAEQESIAEQLTEIADPRQHARLEALSQEGGIKYQLEIPYYQNIQANSYKNNLLHNSTSNLSSKGVPFC